MFVLASVRPLAGWRLGLRAPGGDEDADEAGRAVAQLAEDGTAKQVPEPIPRDVVEQRAKPPAIQAEVHDPGGDVDQVCSPDQLDLQAHGHPRPWRVVLFAGIHAALQPLAWPAERSQHPVGQACALGHVRVAARGVQAGVVQPAGAQQQLAVERLIVVCRHDVLGEWAAAQITEIDPDWRKVGVLELDWSGPEPSTVDDVGTVGALRLTHHSWGGRLSHTNCDWVLPRSYRVIGSMPLVHDRRANSYMGRWRVGDQL